MLEIVGSQTFYTDTREKPRKKYVNWRYRSGGKTPNFRSKSATQYRSKPSSEHMVSESETQSRIQGLFDSSLSPGDLQAPSSFSESPPQVSNANPKFQNPFSFEPSDVMLRSCDLEAHDETMSQSQFFINSTRSLKCHRNDPLMTRSLTVADDMRWVNSSHEWAKLRDQNENLTSIDQQLKVAREKLDRLRFEEAELIWRYESKLASETTLPKWYELKNPEFCIQASKNNKKLKRDQRLDKENAMALSIDSQLP